MTDDIFFVWFYSSFSASWLFFALPKYASSIFLERWRSISAISDVPWIPWTSASISYCIFIGQRKTKIIVCSALIGSITNIILDYLLIYGVPGAIPSLDCSCAAIDTNISEFTKVMILISIFFNSHNRKNLKY